MLPYYGGKQSKMNWLLSHFPPHQTFVDVFGGGGSVAFSKPPSALDIYNDIDTRLCNFFWVLRHPVHGKVLLRALELTPCSRLEHHRCQMTESESIVEQRRGKSAPVAASP